MKKLFKGVAVVTLICALPALGAPSPTIISCPSLNSLGGSLQSPGTVFGPNPFDPSPGEEYQWNISSVTPNPGALNGLQNDQYHAQVLMSNSDPILNCYSDDPGYTAFSLQLNIVAQFGKNSIICTALSNPTYTPGFSCTIP